MGLINLINNTIGMEKGNAKKSTIIKNNLYGAFLILSNKTARPPCEI